MKTYHDLTTGVAGRVARAAEALDIECRRGGTGYLEWLDLPDDEAIIKKVCAAAYVRVHTLDSGARLSFERTFEDIVTLAVIDVLMASEQAATTLTLAIMTSQETAGMGWWADAVRSSCTRLYISLETDLFPEEQPLISNDRREQLYQLYKAANDDETPFPKESFPAIRQSASKLKDFVLDLRAELIKSAALMAI